MKVSNGEASEQEKELNGKCGQLNWEISRVVLFSILIKVKRKVRNIKGSENSDY